MLSWVRATTLAASVLLPTAALAESQSEILFQHKHWEVEIVGFDDGSFACLAVSVVERFGTGGLILERRSLAHRVQTMLLDADGSSGGF